MHDAIDGLYKSHYQLCMSPTSSHSYHLIHSKSHSSPRDASIPTHVGNILNETSLATPRRSKQVVISLHEFTARCGSTAMGT